MRPFQAILTQAKQWHVAAGAFWQVSVHFSQQYDMQVELASHLRTDMPCLATHYLPIEQDGACLPLVESMDESEFSATFALEDEDHTLANALRFFLNKE